MPAPAVPSTDPSRAADCAPDRVPGAGEHGSRRASSPQAAAGLDDLLVLAATESPDKLAVVEAAGRSLTWSELHTEVGRVASGLGEAGIVAGYRVLLVLGNHLEFVTTYLGALRAQAVAVPLDPSSSAAEVERALVDSGARMVLADAASVTTVREALAGLDEGAMAYRPRLVAIGTTLCPGERSYDHLRADRPRPVPALRDAEQLAVLLYTSGTTGAPRAAMLTHRALRANVEQVARVEPPLVHGDDVVLGLLPLFGIYGLGAVLGAVLRQRAKLVLVDGFDASDVLDLIEDEACSVVPLSPGVLAHWRDIDHLADRLGPVRLVLSGSAPLHPRIAAEFTERTGLPVHQGYGLTETAPVVASTLGGPAPTEPTGPREAGTVGAVLPGVEVGLLDPDGEPVEPGDPGEVVVRGDQLFSGYWPDGAGGPDADGWWATGDVAMFDARGDLVLVDRLAETVVVAGFTVYPIEVEAVLADTPGVRAVAVVGEPEPATGQRVVAHVVPAAGTDPEVVLAAVRDRAARWLAAFKRPAEVVIADRLPTTRTGKIARRRLRATSGGTRGAR